MAGMNKKDLVAGPFGTVSRLEKFKKDWDETTKLVLKGLRRRPRKESSSGRRFT